MKNLFGENILSFEEARSFDKFYTKDNVVKKCLKEICLSKYDLVIEPSAGSGSFSNEIKHNNLVSLDIFPENKNIRKQDWLKYKIPKSFKKVIILGNPPFGNRNNLSISFIKHSLSFSNVKTIAFVLPNVYNKYTLQKNIPKDWRISKIVSLDKNSFEINGESYHVPCSFFIFEKGRGRDLRVDPKKYVESLDFEWGDKNNFDVFMFGASPKKLITNEPNKNNRGYYLKSKIKVSELIKKIREIEWEGNSSVNGGVAWFTKMEIIKKYDDFFYNLE